MSHQSRDRLGLAILLVVIITAVLFVNPFFRYSCSRVFMHDFLGMEHGMMTSGPFFSERGLAFGLPLLVMLFLWAAVALWTYHDAERRGHSGLLWGLFVFFGNFIGLIIYLIVRSTATEPAHAFITSGAATCPSCARPIKSTYVACPHCGTSLAKKCAGCGNRTEMDWKVCPHCGKTLNGQ
jgi:predicted RNA-binding Zn-ribbon protein involved in translation (DUF1610 family)